MDSLANAVSHCKYSLLVLAIPEIKMLTQINEEIVSNLTERVGRVAIPRNIVGKKDAAHVLIRALIKKVESESHREIDSLYEVYKNNTRSFPASISTADYLEKMRAYYPFHPQYIEVLYDKIASLETFQSTRDILRLTAHVLHVLCRKDQRRMVFLSDINMAEKSIIDEFLDRHGFANLRRAIEVDLEVVKKLDEENVRRNLPAIFVPLYSSIAVYSVAGEAASVKDLTLATIKPGLHPNYVLGALEQMMESDVAYVYKLTVDGETKYTIKERISWVRLVDIKSRDVSNEDARQEFDSRFNEALRRWGRSIFSIVSLAKSPRDVKDDEILKLVFLDPNVVRDEEETLNFFAIYFDPAKQELRKFRNSVVFALPDQRVYSKSLEIAKKIIAALRIREAKETYGLSEEDIEELTKQINKWREELKERAAAIYSRVAYPIGGKNGGIRFEIKTVNHTNPVEAAAKLLEREEKVIRDISETYLFRLVNEYYAAMGDVELKIKELSEFFARDPEKPYLLKAASIVSDKIAELVENGKVVVLKGGKVYAYQRVKVEEDDVVIPGKIAEQKGLCVEYDGKFIPPPPSELAKPVWDEKSRKWVEGEVTVEEKAEVEERGEEVEEKVEIEKPKKLKLENINLPELIDAIKGESGTFLGFEISGEATKDVQNTINFLKSLSVQLKKLEPEFSISAEVGDGDNIDLRLTGDVKVSGIKEVLTMLERLGCRNIRYEIVISEAKAEDLLESLDVKLLREKYRKEKFSVSARVKE